MSTGVKKSNPDLVDILNEHKRDVMLSLNCHAVGIIKEFDHAKQTCRVQIAYEKTILERDNSGRYIPTLKPYPILVDVPVIVIHGGVSGLTMPIKPGDSCLVMFNDRDIDNWFSGATAGDVASNRLHSLSDGIALVGLRPSTKPIQNYESDKTVLFYGANKVSLSENDVVVEKGNAKITVSDKIKIEVNGQSLGALLESLTNAIVNMTTTAITTAPGDPIAVPNVTGVTSAMNQIKGVLE